MSLNAADVKQFCLSAGADVVGIASMDRFEGAPLQSDPRQIFPDAKSMIVMGFRIPRGTLRGIEEGTYYVAYASMGYAAINFILQPMTLWKITAMIEDEGYEAVPIPNNFPWTNKAGGDGQPNLRFSKPVAEGRAAPDVFIHMRIAAMAAGVGEIGWSKMLLTKRFGPRQRLAAIITDAELEPDPVIAPGTICDRCMCCARDCTGAALPTDKSVKIKLAGYDVEWGDIDYDVCSRYFCGASPEYNPFMTNFPEDQEGFQKPVHEAQRYKVGPIYEYGRALEGARGCIRACMMHLEQVGRIENQFKHPFRRRDPWKL